MFAIIKLGGLQHVVRKGDVIKVNKLDALPDSQIVIREVFAKGTKESLEVGVPFVDNSRVTAKILEQTKDKKVIIFKKKRRHNYRKKVGFRQSITRLEILDIQ